MDLTFAINVKNLAKLIKIKNKFNKIIFEKEYKSLKDLALECIQLSLPQSTRLFISKVKQFKNKHHLTIEKLSQTIDLYFQIKNLLNPSTKLKTFSKFTLSKNQLKKFKLAESQLHELKMGLTNKYEKQILNHNQEYSEIFPPPYNGSKFLPIPFYHNKSAEFKTAPQVIALHKHLKNILMDVEVKA